MTTASKPEELRSTYESFIVALRPLVDEGRTFAEDKSLTADSAVVRAWRHNVHALTRSISRTHHDSSTNIGGRIFKRTGYVDAATWVHRPAFESDLRQTITELESIISRWEVLGEPTRKGAPLVAVEATQAATARAPEQEWPDDKKLTLYWLVKNMPVSAWAWLFGLLVSAFLTGMWIGSRFDPKEQAPSTSPISLVPQQPPAANAQTAPAAPQVKEDTRGQAPVTFNNTVIRDSGNTTNNTQIINRQDIRVDGARSPAPDNSNKPGPSQATTTPLGTGLTNDLTNDLTGMGPGKRP